MDPSSESSDVNITWRNHGNQESKKVFWLGWGGTGAAGQRCYEGENGTTGVVFFWDPAILRERERRTKTVKMIEKATGKPIILCLLKYI